MCLILVAWRVHPAYPLVVAANRDEFFDRPTAAADFWPDGEILAGRDLQAGGTWLGIDRHGRFAALTNYRDPSRLRADAVSRGGLVADFLARRLAPLDWVNDVAAQAERCNGFNILAGDGRELVWASNVSGERRRLAPGVFGVSNHLLDTPWPKLTAARSALAAALTLLPDDQSLFDLLGDDAIHPDEALPRTGISLEWERLLSSAFVRAPGYGTRSSTIVLVPAAGDAIVFDEQTWLPGGMRGSRHRFRFTRRASS